MKNNVISIFLFAMFITLPSCVDSGGQTNTDENNTYKQYDVSVDTQILTLDSCEYIVSKSYMGHYVFTHKGNCRNCRKHKNNN